MTRWVKMRSTGVEADSLRPFKPVKIIDTHMKAFTCKYLSGRAVPVAQQ